MMLYAESGADRQSRLPSYFFSETIGEWVIFRLDAASHSHLIPTQLIITRKKQLTLLTQEPENKRKKIAYDILAIIHTMTFERDIRPSLPTDFAAMSAGAKIGHSAPRERSAAAE
jgi:hypothetical protein